MGRQHDDLWGIIEPWLADEHIELDDLELVGSGRGRTLKVLVDAEGGVDIDRIAELSDGISRLLDDDSDLEGPYQLEVSSPGLERKLKRHRHYEKSIGREVSVKSRSDDQTRIVKGVLAEVGSGSIMVRTDEGDDVTVDLETVTSAKTVYRWQAAPKPGKK